MENKMSDNDVIKAMEFCIEHKDDCVGCPFENDAKKCVWLNLEHSLGVINRRNAEIERLKKLLEKADIAYTKCAKQFYKEATKDFAERLKDLYTNDKRYDRPNAHTLIETLFDNIDNLVKEMTGEA